MTLTLVVKVGVIHVHALIKFQNPKCIIYRDMNYCPVIFGQVTDRQTDRLQTEYDAYEPTVRGAQVGSKITEGGGILPLKIILIYLKQPTIALSASCRHCSIPLVF